MDMKPTLIDIDTKISKAAKILDEVACMVRDAGLEPEKNIRRIGTALTYIFEVQHEAWRADPNLVPNCLKGKVDKETGKKWGSPTSGSSGLPKGRR